MSQILADAPMMWRRINSIGIILDCNRAYSEGLGYDRRDIIGKPIFEHVPKESWEEMNDSLRTWFETGTVTDRRITFQRRDKSTFLGLLAASSLYDEGGSLLGSNTVIFDIAQLTDERISSYERFIADARAGLSGGSGSEHEGMVQLFEMLSGIDLRSKRLRD